MVLALLHSNGRGSKGGRGGGRRGGHEIQMRKNEEMFHFPLRKQRRTSKNETSHRPLHLRQRIHPPARTTTTQQIHQYHYNHYYPTNYKITHSTPFIQANTSLQTSTLAKRSERNGRDTDIPVRSLLLLLQLLLLLLLCNKGEP